MASEEQVREQLKQVKDPELDVDIASLGLVYGIEIAGHLARIKMTLTTPFCPYGPALISDVKRKVLELPDISGVEVELVWEPKWEPTEELKTQLGLG